MTKKKPTKEQLEAEGYRTLMAMKKLDEELKALDERFQLIQSALKTYE